MAFLHRRRACLWMSPTRKAKNVLFLARTRHILFVVGVSSVCVATTLCFSELYDQYLVVSLLHLWRRDGANSVVSYLQVRGT